MDRGPGKERIDLHSYPRLIGEPQIQQVFEISPWGPKFGERAKRGCASILFTNSICPHLLLDSLPPTSFPPILFSSLPKSYVVEGWAGLVKICGLETHLERTIPISPLVHPP